VTGRKGRMRIAYISLYQGPGLLKSRPTTLNRSLANTIKLETIAQILRAGSHEVEVLSQGEVVEHKCQFYPAFREPDPFSASIPVYYASALPIRRLNALWSSTSLIRLFRSRHRALPFDLAIVWNLKHPQLVCAEYAWRRLKIPVILQYEDDAFVSVSGGARRHSFGYVPFAARVLQGVSGCMACSPRLLSQLPADIPKLLLRGVVGADLVALSRQTAAAAKRNWVLFSGTHAEQYGIPSLITAWGKAELAGWELHITGEGPDTPGLKKLAENGRGVQFHGLVSRQELVRLMCSARICVNPHELSQTPGNVFAFKIIEYLAAGAHVITTPMGALEKEYECGITYMPDNKPDTIASSLMQAIADRCWERTAAPQVIERLGPAGVARSLGEFIRQAVDQFAHKSFRGEAQQLRTVKPDRPGSILEGAEPRRDRYV
jgi:glycosyltransferase involved in cell wall biosynthesis